MRSGTISFTKTEHLLTAYDTKIIAKYLLLNSHTYRGWENVVYSQEWQESFMNIHVCKKDTRPGRLTTSVGAGECKQMPKFYARTHTHTHFKEKSSKNLKAKSINIKCIYEVVLHNVIDGILRDIYALFVYFILKLCACVWIRSMPN